MTKVNYDKTIFALVTGLCLVFATTIGNAVFASETPGSARELAQALSAGAGDDGKQTASPPQALLAAVLQFRADSPSLSREERARRWWD
ncbi:MAG: hypothetical protein HKN19_18745, partial [Halioglobus sp.]|nr:hypothetical protein [Halioglobus sp.]